MTIKDIARIAGVSHSTVSRALNDNPMINKDTRERIKAIALEHHFEFNAAARSLSIRKTGVIAVIYKANLDVFGFSLYASQLFLELRHSLEHHQLDAIILEAYNPGTGESNISRLIRQNRVDGFLLVHSDIPEEDYKLIQDHKLPLVQLHLNSCFYPMESMDYFLTDNEHGGFLAGEHLIAKGCRKMLCLSVDEDLNDEYRNRSLGFKKALSHQENIELNEVALADCSYDSGYRYIKENQETVREMDALFVQADIIAFGCLNALKELGISVPEDLLLVSFDDTPACTMTKPYITTVHQPRETLSHLACNRISDMVKGEGDGEKVQLLLKTELVVRDTA